MARYFFHLQHAKQQLDEAGLDLASDTAAWREGVAACSEFMHDLDGQMDSDSEYRMECVDENDRKVFVLRFSAEKFFT